MNTSAARAAPAAREDTAAPPLSDVHRALAGIERQHHARRLNEIANHPTVYPTVRGYSTGPLDLTAVVANPANILLVGEQGALLFVSLQPGLFEVHSQCLPEGRGAWMVRFVRACLHWVFTRTDAVEILTRCPTVATKALATRIGGKHLFTNPRGWVMDLDPVPADIYGIGITDWMRTAPGLEERGHWFHEKLEAEFARHNKVEPNHPDDDVHDRYVGAACEMFLGGQPVKAAIFYARWAKMADYEPFKILNFDPLTVDIGTAILIVPTDGRDFWIAACR